jgi:hypothetical protein
MSSNAPFRTELHGRGIAELVRMETVIDMVEKRTVTKLKIPQGHGWKILSFSCPEDLVDFGEEISRMGRELALQTRPIMDSLLQEQPALGDSTDSPETPAEVPSSGKLVEAFFWHNPEACAFGFTETAEEARGKAVEAVALANKEARFSDGTFADGELQICYGTVLGRAVVSSEKPPRDFAPLVLLEASARG